MHLPRATDECCDVHNLDSFEFSCCTRSSASSCSSYRVHTTGGETTFLDAAVRAGEITRDYDDLMCSFHNAFFAKDATAMDYIEQVQYIY